jgi:hypothetical protein
MACGCYPIAIDITAIQSWIQHQQNSHLVTVDDENQLAEELIWAFKNTDFRIKAIAENRQFIEKQANYSLNMKVISANTAILFLIFKPKNNILFDLRRQLITLNLDCKIYAFHYGNPSKFFSKKPQYFWY